MTFHLFSFREQFSFSPPYFGEVQTVWESAKRLVCEIICDNTVHSAVLMHRNIAMCLLPDGERPLEILFPDGTRQNILATRENADFSFCVFEESQESLPVEADLRYDVGRFVFKVGVENSIPFDISFGEITRIKKHDKRYKSDWTKQEIGSAVFSRKGELMGVTVGEIGNDWVACSTRDVVKVFVQLKKQMRQ